MKMTVKKTYKKQRQRHTDTDKDKDTQTQTKTNTKCFEDLMYTIFFKSRGFKDLRYYIGCLLMMTKTKNQFDSI